MTSIPQNPRRAVATVTIVGRGRLGRAVATALREVGVHVNGPTARGEVVPHADVVLLCVPDAEIAAVAGALGERAGWVGHMSGATPIQGLDVDFALHPLQTFVGDEGAQAFRGIGCAIAGCSPEATDAARELATRLGARPFTIEDEQRAGYHAAASIASNFVVTVLGVAEQVARDAGIDESDVRDLLAPLVRRTVENWVEVGAEKALTGPVARGDRDTVTRQRDAVMSRTPDALGLFDALVDGTRALAAKGVAS